MTNITPETIIEILYRKYDIILKKQTKENIKSLVQSLKEKKAIKFFNKDFLKIAYDEDDNNYIETKKTSEESFFDFFKDN
jgi:hypothetical protein